MSVFRTFLRRSATLALVALVLAPTLFAAERIPPMPQRYFTDETRTVSAGTANQLNATLERYERESSNQILVAMYPKMASDSSVEDYTVRVAEKWRVGQKGRNNGAVLFVFKEDRQIYIQVGYGLEAVLPDATAHDIVENILKPRFRAGDFEGGLTAAVSAMIAATRGEYQGSGRTQADRTRGSNSPMGFFSLLFVIVMITIFSRYGRRRSVLLGGPHMRRRGPNIWWGGPGGGFGGGGFGGGGGGGGFSGGGGSFGGGGAGGKW
ncbi:MAG: hypothetical protein C0518_10715 [Opitutus sp.]|nr:hypothetical protein [Opitutus sp.]